MLHRLPLLPPDDQSTGDDREEDSGAPRRPLPVLPLRPVRRLVRPSPSTIRRFARAGLPAVIVGGLDETEAVGRFTGEHLRPRIGHVRAASYVLPQGSILIDAKRGFELRELSFAEYADDVLANRDPGCYFRTPLERLPADVQREIPTPEVCRGAPRLRRNLWYSAEGTTTRLHFDLPHNLIAQLTGHKRFILYPFGEYLNLYPFPPWSSVPHLARVDVAHPDFRRFPKLPLARGFHCDLAPGEMLLLPSRTWHYAYSMTHSVTVNFWWPPPSILPLSLLSDAYKWVRGLNI